MVYKNEDISTAQFAHTVLLLSSTEEELKFEIVGEDEADVANHKISYVFPLAKALIGQGIGEVVLWERPIGNLELEIVAIF